MLATINQNNLKKVIPMNLGIGSKEGFINFTPMGQFGPMSQINKNGKVKIKIISIDKFVSDKEVDVGLIKMDLEGYELVALNGAIDTIKKFKPILLISIYHNPEQFINVIKFVQELKIDYKISIKHLGGAAPISETYLIAW